MGQARQLARTVLSFLPKLRLIGRPDLHRPDGLSVMMTVKDEEDWIEKSIRSIAPVADDIVVVDNGSDDGTPGILKKLARELPEKLRAFQFDREDYCAAVNHTLARTRFKWVLRWPGDFVARTSGNLGVRRLVDRIGRLDPARYYCIWLGPISLDGDLFHQIPQAEVEREPLVFVYSPRLHYRQIGRFEVLQVPWVYKRLEWRELYFFHMRYVKPARRILYRFFWTEWMSLTDKSSFPTLDSFVRHRIQEVYGTDSLPQAMTRRIQDLSKELVPYDMQRYGEYPEILKEDLERPKYRLIYEGNRIVGRSDIQ